MLKIDNLSKLFEKESILNDFNYHFKPKTIYALMGANGSGKTTLFNLINGFLKPDGGDIFYKEKNIKNLSTHQIASLGVGRTFQDLRLIPTISVYENILLAIKNKKSEKLLYSLFLSSKNYYNKKIEEILIKTHLFDVKDLKASEISYGQQKLLNLAVILANDFDLLLLDEPVAGVQPEYRKQILQLIKSFDKTVIVIEHNPEFLEELTKNILFLDGGKIIAEGDYQTIKQNKKVQEAYL
jgi:branched-chain amino acid transport system ATP-binding protein